MQSIKDNEYDKLPDTEVQENGKAIKRPVIKLKNTFTMIFLHFVVDILNRGIF